MFSAIDTVENKKIYAFNFEKRSDITVPKGKLLCPHCENTVFPRGGRTGLILHFTHCRKCTSTLEYHPESIQHLLGKLTLLQYMKQAPDSEGFDEITVEYPIPEAGENGRIADVAGIYKAGYALIYECQLASITPEQLEKRTNDYKSAAAEVIWWLGGKADTQINREWCHDYLYRSFNIKYSELINEYPLFEYKPEPNPPG